MFKHCTDKIVKTKRRSCAIKHETKSTTLEAGRINLMLYHLSVSQLIIFAFCGAFLIRCVGQARAPVSKFCTVVATSRQFVNAKLGKQGSGINSRMVSTKAPSRVLCIDFQDRQLNSVAVDDTGLQEIYFSGFWSLICKNFHKEMIDSFKLVKKISIVKVQLKGSFIWCQYLEGFVKTSFRNIFKLSLTFSVDLSRETVILFYWRQ